MTRHRKKYKFSDEIVTSDSVVSMISGTLGLMAIIAAIIYSFVKKGNVGYTTGASLLSGGILGLLALIFSVFSYRNTDGGILTKRFTFILALVDIAIPMILYLKMY